MAMHCVARETGKESWSFKMKTRPEARLLIAGETAFISTATETYGDLNPGAFYATPLRGVER